MGVHMQTGRLHMQMGVLMEVSSQTRFGPRAAQTTDKQTGKQTETDSHIDKQTGRPTNQKDRLSRLRDRRTSGQTSRAEEQAAPQVIWI